MQGNNSNAVIAFSAPDSCRVKTDMVEAILIGKVTYFNLNGKWTKMDIDLTSLISSFRDPKLIESGISNLKYIGVEHVNGFTADAYNYTISTTLNGQKLSAKDIVWISRVDHLPLNMEVNVEKLSENTVSTITYEYAGNISI